MSERDYLERTIATVRQHGDSWNCWPQWAGALADEVERLWAERDVLAARLAEAEKALRPFADIANGFDWDTIEAEAPRLPVLRAGPRISVTYGELRAAGAYFASLPSLPDSSGEGQR